MSSIPFAASVTGPDTDLGGRGGNFALIREIVGLSDDDTRLLLLVFILYSAGGRRLGGGAKSLIGADSRGVGFPLV